MRGYTDQDSPKNKNPPACQGFPASGGAALRAARDYYPFGFEMPGRKYNFGDYRYGFNGKENDSDGEFGSLTHYDYGFRIYKPAVGRFLSVDPLTREYPWYTPYQFAGNMPIAAIDVDGLEPAPVNPGSFEGQVQTQSYNMPSGYSGWSPPQKDYYYFSGGKNAYGGIEAGWFSRSQYEGTIKEIGNSYGVALANAEKYPGCYCPKGALPELGDYFSGLDNLGEGWQEDFGGVLAGAVSSGYNRTLNSGSGALEHSNVVFDAITLIQGGILLKQGWQSLSRRTATNGAPQILGQAPSSRVLGQNLEAAGFIRPPNAAAHHMVAGADRRAAIARSILQREGIDINSATNGVFIPKSTQYAKPPAITHTRIHTNKYYQSLNSRLQNATNVSKELNQIRKDILNGSFPY